MSIRLTNAAASAGANSTGISGYAGSSPKIAFHEGAVNANAELAPAGDLLATLTIASFGAASEGTIASAGGSAAAGASGTPACFVLYKNDGTTKVLDGSVGEKDGENPSGEDIDFEDGDITWVAGGTVSLSSFSLTLPPH